MKRPADFRVRSHRRSCPAPRRGSTATLFLALLCVVLVPAIVGCEKRAGPMEKEYKPTSSDIDFRERCNSKTGDQECTLKITGAAGDSARLDVRCGATTFASCTATIPAGAAENTCDIPRTTVPNNEGTLTHGVTRLAGRPASAASCTPL